MTLDQYSTLLVSGSIAMFILAVGAGFGALVSSPVRARLMAIDYKWYLAALAAVSIVSIFGSLTYQLVYETPVCELCWWQRIFLYPVSVITLVALWYKTRESHVTGGILSLFGLWYAPPVLPGLVGLLAVGSQGYWLTCLLRRQVARG